jgi:hypothetical protein
VTDAQGGVVVNALATLTLSGGRAVTVTTGADGTFTFPGVAPGIYALDVESAGFVRWRERVVVPAPMPIAVTLQVAGLSENIQVIASTPTTLEALTVMGSRLGLTLLETPASVQILPGGVIRERDHHLRVAHRMRDVPVRPRRRHLAVFDRPAVPAQGRALPLPVLGVDVVASLRRPRVRSGDIHVGAERRLLAEPLELGAGHRSDEGAVARGRWRTLEAG